jgi:hypothetical protein
VYDHYLEVALIEDEDEEFPEVLLKLSYWDWHLIRYAVDFFGERLEQEVERKSNAGTKVPQYRLDTQRKLLPRLKWVLAHMLEKHKDNDKENENDK